MGHEWDMKMKENKLIIRNKGHERDRNGTRKSTNYDWLNDKKQHNDKIRQENLWRYEGHERDNKKEIIHYYVKKRDTRDTKSIHGTRMGHK